MRMVKDYIEIQIFQCLDDFKMSASTRRRGEKNSIKIYSIFINNDIILILAFWIART